MTQIHQLKEKSGAARFASVFGKATIPTDHAAYKMIEGATQILLENGYGILHGGYDGGAMSAASNTAARYIKEHNLPKELNIGVPQLQHDGLWARVTDATFTDSAEDIYDRMKIITSSDIAVVSPLGGDGTELEETIVFHENVVRERVVKETHDNSYPPIPLVFLLIPGCTDWKKILDVKAACLATNVKDLEACPWIHFVDSLEDFEKLVISLKNTA